jgi:hypothetical protein
MTTELAAELQAFSQSYFATHDMDNASNLAAFAELQRPYVSKIQDALKGTVAEPLVNEHRALQAELQKASTAGNKDEVQRIAKDCMAIGNEVEKWINHQPVYQIRWVAMDKDTNLPVEVLPDAHDASKSVRLLKPALNEHDIASAGFTRLEPDNKEITLQLNPRGGAAFSADAGKSLGRPLAVTWQGAVLAVARSWRCNDKEATLCCNLPDTEAQQLLDVLNHRSLAQPTNNPSPR